LVPLKTTAQMTPEMQLLLACCSNNSRSNSHHAIRTLCRQGIDWDVLIQISLIHGILPIVFQHLSTESLECVPQAVMQKLRNHYKANARQSLLLSLELQRILQSFKQAGIKAVPYKGPVLAELIYGDLALRQSADIDIMISKSDVTAASEILVSQDYRPDPKYQLNWEAHFIKSEGRFVVDLHWGVTTTNIYKTKDLSFKLDLRGIRNRVTPAEFLGMAIHTFSPEDLLMIRCQDAVKEFWKNNWPQLKWIIDIDRIIDYSNINWTRLVADARKQGNLRLLYLCLSLARQLMNTSIPQPAIQAIQKDKHVSLLTRKVLDRLMINNETENRFLDPMRGFLNRSLFCIKLKERPSDKIKYLRKFYKEYLNRVRRVIKFDEDRNLLLLPRPFSYLLVVLQDIYTRWHLNSRSRNAK
jgi:putative nucleotidyltransferase-like protein